MTAGIAPKPNSYEMAQTNMQNEVQSISATPPIKIEKQTVNRTHSAGLNAMEIHFAERNNMKNAVQPKNVDALSMHTHHNMEREDRIFAFDDEV